MISWYLNHNLNFILILREEISLFIIFEQKPRLQKTFWIAQNFASHLYQPWVLTDVHLIPLPNREKKCPKCPTEMPYARLSIFECEMPFLRAGHRAFLSGISGIFFLDWATEYDEPLLITLDKPGPRQNFPLFAKFWTLFNSMHSILKGKFSENSIDFVSRNCFRDTKLHLDPEVIKILFSRWLQLSHLERKILIHKKM